MTANSTDPAPQVRMKTHRITIGIDRTTSYYFKHEIALPADTPDQDVDALLEAAVKERTIDEITDGDDDGSAEGEYLEDSVRIAEGDDDDDDHDDELRRGGS